MEYARPPIWGLLRYWEERYEGALNEREKLDMVAVGDDCRCLGEKLVEVGVEGRLQSCCCISDVGARQVGTRQ